jgi:hypothetical protein
MWSGIFTVDALGYSAAHNGNEITSNFKYKSWINQYVKIREMQ